MARRQSLIPTEALPAPDARLDLFETARRLFRWDGYVDIGIDHFATPEDGLSVAQKAGRLGRNFQGYTDDTAEALIGVGASSISRFPQGYTQNAPATSAHTAAIREGRFSTSRGHAFQGEDRLRARMIEALMCDFHIDSAEIRESFGLSPQRLDEMYQNAARAFPDLLEIDDDGLSIPEPVRPLTRMIARSFDAYDLSKAGHSSAI